VDVEEASPKLLPSVPPKLKEVIEVISNNLIVTCAKWNTLIELFGADKKNLDLMNRIAPHFFVVLQDTYLDSVLLGITRLLDPAKSRDKRNLTLYTLGEVLGGNATLKLKREYEEELRALNTLAATLKLHRDKRIAHTDYGVATKAESLPAFFIKTVKEALARMAALVNKVTGYYYDSATLFDGLRGEGEHMIHLLRKAETQIEGERKLLFGRMGTGEPCS
jgi:hypothetical protein